MDWVDLVVSGFRISKTILQRRRVPITKDRGVPTHMQNDRLKMKFIVFGYFDLDIFQQRKCRHRKITLKTELEAG